MSFNSVIMTVQEMRNVYGCSFFFLFCIQIRTFKIRTYIMGSSFRVHFLFSSLYLSVLTSLYVHIFIQILLCLNFILFDIIIFLHFFRLSQVSSMSLTQVLIYFSVPYITFSFFILSNILYNFLHLFCCGDNFSMVFFFLFMWVISLKLLNNIHFLPWELSKQLSWFIAIFLAFSITFFLLSKKICLQLSHIFYVLHTFYTLFLFLAGLCTFMIIQGGIQKPTFHSNSLTLLQQKVNKSKVQYIQ